MSRQVDLKALVSHVVKGDGVDKCRICMGDTTEGQVYLGDTVMTDGEKHLTLAELLYTVTGVQVEAIAELPDKVCHICLERLMDSISFISLCKESSKKWNDVADYLERFPVPNKLRAIYVIIGDHEMATITDTFHNLKEPAKNPKEAVVSLKKKLKRQFYNKKVIKKVIIPKVEKNIVNLKCPECEKPFKYEHELNIHIKNTKLHFCRFCQSFLRVDEAISHYQGHGVTVHLCELCWAVFTSQKFYSKHILRKHQRGKHICFDCKQSFLDSKVLSLHVSKKHVRKKCTDCDKSFTTAKCYEYHAKRCHNVTPKKKKEYICHYCSRVHKQRTNLITHLTTHLGGMKYQCQYCGKHFPTEFRLEEHGNIHNRVEDRYVCVLCTAKYSTRRGYEKHLKRHAVNEGLIPHVPAKPRPKQPCHLCDKIYACKKGLHKHLEKIHQIVIKTELKMTMGPDKISLC